MLREKGCCLLSVVVVIVAQALILCQSFLSIELSAKVVPTVVAAEASDSLDVDVDCLNGDDGVRVF